MRLSLDEEPSFEEIQTQTLLMFGFKYWDACLSLDRAANAKRVDMENTVERMLINQRLAAKQKDFAQHQQFV